MIILLTIFQYLIQATVDLMDKFLISVRKVEPVSYTFYTVVTGLCLLAIWPWVFQALAVKFIIWDLLSGALFSLAMYVFFLCLSQGEVSRVIPFIFGLVPVFDIFIAQITGRNALNLYEVAAVCLLIPGALLISHQKHDRWSKHVALKTLSAFLFSGYYAVWQFAAQSGPALNNLMWDRIGAAAVLLIPLVFLKFRKKVFGLKTVKHRRSTSVMFLFKQVLGGANFVFLSMLLVVGKISVISSLQGFRYIFVLFLAALISRHRKHFLKEQIDKGVLWQKAGGIALVCLGTVFLFLHF